MARSPAPPPVQVEHDAWATMRDGCRLAADIYRPTDAPPSPVLLLRTPYDRRVSTQTFFAPPQELALEGFLVVVQDCRGRFGSEGDFEPFVHEAEDGHDTIEWAARLPGANGQVVTYGASYAGYLQLLAAAERPPSLRAIVPVLPGSDVRDSWFFPGGTTHLVFVACWSAILARADALRDGRIDDAERLNRFLGDPLPTLQAHALGRLPAVVELAPYLRRWLTTAPDDPYWAEISARARLDRIDVPALLVSGWFDGFHAGTVETHARLAELGRSAVSLLVGPWGHAPFGPFVGARDHGPAAEQGAADRAFLRFLRQHAHGDTADDAPTIEYFRLGDGAWRRSACWPPEAARPFRWAIRTIRSAATEPPDRRLSSEPVAGPDDISGWFVYDPANPVRSLGGSGIGPPGVAAVGEADQRPNAQRRDVLVHRRRYEGPARELSGTVTVRLRLRTTAPVADLVARLCIQDAPGAPTRNVAEGAARVRPDDPAELASVRIDLSPTATLVPDGAVVELHLTAGSWPNLATTGHAAGDPFDGSPWRGVPATFEIVDGDLQGAWSLAG